MNARLHARFCFLASVGVLSGLFVPATRGQNLYFISKTQVFTQTSSAGSVADPSTPFTFSAQAPASATLALPAGTTVPIPFSSNNGDYEINQTFATKAALDAAYPLGIYRMTGTGIPTLSFNLGTELYSSVTPQVTSGTWNAGGLLVVDPTVANTITFNTFTGYATTGVAGHMQVKVQGLFDNVKIGGDSSGILSIPNTLGLTVQTTPLTSIAIPARTLTSGGVYQVSIQFDTAATFDTTTVSGGAVVGLFSKTLNFYVAAQAPGTTTPLPVIIGQPTNQTGVLGGSVTFSLGVSVGGSPPGPNLQILWFFNGQQLNLDGSKYGTGINNNPGLTVKNLTAADAGNYSFTLINAAGIVSSNAATLTFVTATAPAITKQPVSLTLPNSGSTAVFSVAATGSPAPTYQWRGPNGNISGATGPTLVLTGITGNNASLAGSYSVVVSNGVGNSITSNAATLSFLTGNDPGRLINLSVLTDISTAVPNFTVATVVGGAGTSGGKSLVIRADGPALGALGYPGTMSDPQLSLYNSTSASIGSNDNWGGSAALTAAMASVGAFAFPSPTSLDAAINPTNLSPGNYSVIVSGTNGSTGNVIAEIYDATPAGTFTVASPRLINVSVNKQISAGGLLSLGFTVGGSTAKTVLIRVIGPGLVQFGYPTGAVLSDPQLTLYSNSTSAIIAANNDWGADPQLISAASRVNAFSVGGQPTKDSMLLITLPAGGYTAQASGNGGTGGVAIVEVYEVP